MIFLYNFYHFKTISASNFKKMPPKRKTTSILKLSDDSIIIENTNSKKQRTIVNDEKVVETEKQTVDTAKTSSDEDSNHTPLVVAELVESSSRSVTPILNKDDKVTTGEKEEEDDRVTLYSSDSRDNHKPDQQESKKQSDESETLQTILSTTPICDSFEPDMDALILVWFTESSAQQAFCARHCKTCRHFHGPITSLKNTSEYREAVEEEAQNCHLREKPCEPSKHNWVASPPDDVPVCSICFNSDGSDA